MQNADICLPVFRSHRGLHTGISREHDQLNEWIGHETTNLASACASRIVLNVYETVCAQFYLPARNQAVDLNVNRD